MNDAPPAVTTTVRDGIARIDLSRPPVNALNLPTIRALIDALRAASTDPAVRAIVLASGIPHRFCAGLDLDHVHGRTPAEMHEVLSALYVEMTDVQSKLGKPTIAAVGGAARGAGMTIAISCDVVIAGEGATFGYPEIDVGLIPGIHFVHLPRIVGRHRAFELLFSGRSFPASEALSLGLVSRVVPDGEVVHHAEALARVFAGKSPEVMKLARAAFHRACDIDYRKGIAEIVDVFCLIAGTADSREGVAAFVEKRTPAWKK
jgi:enoyl-CoA hydratase/carnithine racemase